MSRLFDVCQTECCVIVYSVSYCPALTFFHHVTHVILYVWVAQCRETFVQLVANLHLNRVESLGNKGCGLTLMSQLV